MKRLILAAMPEQALRIAEHTRQHGRVTHKEVQLRTEASRHHPAGTFPPSDGKRTQ